MRKIRVEIEAIVCDHTLKAMSNSSYLLRDLKDVFNLYPKDGEKITNLKITEDDDSGTIQGEV